MRTRVPRRRPTRLGSVLAGTTVVGAGLLLAVGPASAHVGIGEGDYHAGSYVVLPFSVPHGCDESPTTKVRIQIPESIPTVTPTVNPGWDVAIVKEALDTPLDIGEGRTLTERVTEIDYTAKSPLPNGYRDVLELSLQLPEDAAGTTLYFPTIQECAEGSTEWTMLPKNGQDPHELESPAPAIDVVAAESEGHGEGEDADKSDEPADGAAPGDAPTTTAAPADDDSGSNGADRGLAIAGLTTGVIGMALGGRALLASKGSK